MVEELAKASNKKLAQGMSEHNKAMSAAKTEADKVAVVCELSLCLSIYVDQRLYLMVTLVRCTLFLNMSFKVSASLRFVSKRWQFDCAANLVAESKEAEYKHKTTLL